MRLKFWRKPHYFDFSVPRRKTDVTLREFISGIITAIGTTLATALSSAAEAIGLSWGLVELGYSVGMFMGSVLVYAMIGGLLYGLSYALTPKSGKQSSLSTGGLTQNTSMVIDPIRVVYGRQKVGCSQVFIHTTGGGMNRFLHVIAVWCEGPVSGIDTDSDGEMIWISGRRLSEYQAWFGQSWCWHTFHNGALDQAVDTDLQSYFPEWADAMRGTAYSYFRCKSSAALWTEFPQFVAMIKGRTVFDPRDGSIAYSRNPALAWRDFLTHPRYGGGILGSLVDKQSVIDAANWFDSNSIYFDGTVADRKEFLENIEDIRMSCRAEEIWTGGAYKLLVQKYDSPVMSVNEEDILVDNATMGMAMGISTKGIQDVPKRIKVTFADKDNDYIPSYCYWPEATPYAAETDKQWQEIILMGVTGFEEALKIAKFFYLRAQYSTTFTFAAHPRLLPLEIGDMIQMSHDSKYPVGSIPSDWSNKYLRVVAFDLKQTNHIGVTLMEEDSSIYDMTVDVAAHTKYTTTLPQATDLSDDVTGLSATSGEDTTTRERNDAYIDFQWDNMGPGVNYMLHFRQTDVSHWTNAYIYDPGGIIDIPTPSEAGSLTFKAKGNFEGATQLTYVVQIDGTGSPNTFKWSDDGGSTWDATGVAVTATWQTLNNGVKIKFSATTGGVSGDHWTFLAYPVTPVIHRVKGLPVNTEYYWQVRCKAPQLNESDWSSADTSITTWAPAGPATVAFDDSKCNFDGPNPIVAWTALTTEPDHYELRTEDANWGAKDVKFIAFPSGKATLFEWTAYTAWCDKQSLNESQRRSLTIYIKAMDKTGVYSGTADSIALSNAVPTMSTFTPTLTKPKLGNYIMVNWADWSGITATDLDQYKIYASTEATCTITATNLKKTVAKRVHQTEITGLSRGVTYDFRVVPWDVFGEGVASL
jgi:hypothetical protein